MSEQDQESEARLPSISIPESAYQPFRDIVRMDDATFAQLAKAVSAAPAQSSPDRFSENLSESVSGISEDALNAITIELFRMNYVQSEAELSPQQTAYLIADTVKTQEVENPVFEEHELLVLRTRLAELLGAPKALYLTSKANTILMEHQHLFYSANLYTDARPVFSSDAASIDAAVIIHNLSIHYGEGEDHKDFNVVLDDSDIETLRELLDRAEAKSATLREWIKAAGTTFLATDE